MNLSRKLKGDLAGIRPSFQGLLTYYPCTATLTNGTVLDHVYLVPERSYLAIWGMYPNQDSKKRSIRISEVASVAESESRLPANFATCLYQSGETGMGYFIFTVVFESGQKQAYVSGSAVDSIDYPAGQGKNTVSAVLPHVGSESNPLSTPRHYWSVFSG